MKLKEKYEAIRMRKHGASITNIANKLNVSKGSVSAWVKDVTLAPEVLKNIHRRSHSDSAIEKRRLSRIKSESLKRDNLVKNAEKQVTEINTKELFLVGVALYWGEGSKKKRGVVEFTNSDPEMIKVMKYFFEKACFVPSAKFRGHVYIHEHMNIEQAEKYWSKVSGISKKQFHKTSIQKNRKKLHKDTLPYGTFAIVICDTKLKLSIDGWIKGLYPNICK